MYYIFFNAPTPAENLALDEALLTSCGPGFRSGILRFWESSSYFVVLGAGGRLELDVRLDAAEELKIPVLRRISGGGVVLQGPGCLNYSLILPIAGDDFSSITSTNRFVMERNREALQRLVPEAVAVAGETDLVIGSRKFSGNSQRRLRDRLLFHGTLLYDFDLSLVERVLLIPCRAPAYREGRPHSSFLTNVALSPQNLCSCLRSAWGANEELRSLPLEKMKQLAGENYARDAWTHES